MNITNIIHLFRAYFIENKRTLLIYCLITFVVAVLGFSTNTMQIVAVLLPYFILYWVAGTFFQFALKGGSSTHFFSLPVTAGEKFIHAITIILTLGITLLAVTFVGAYAGAYLIRPLYNIGPAIMQMDTTILKLINWDSLSSLSLFLFGSIYFKKNAFIKTWASISGIAIGVTVYFMGLVFLIFGNLGKIDQSMNINIVDYPFFQNYYYLITIAFGVFFLSLTYLRLRETEV